MTQERSRAARAAGHEAIAHAVSAVARLDERFDAAMAGVDVMVAAAGRVVVCGLGKSGLVGAKLAATLASTGTPSQFLHASDALHGDAGVLRAGDVLIAISNSGETAEVCEVARLARARAIPVISFAGCDGSSTLAELADVAVDVSVAREADPFDLVPSSSTAVVAVMGDAMAIAAMITRGHGPAEFHANHPSGSLGKRLATTAQSTGPFDG